MINLLTARGATVGDNLITEILENVIRKKGRTPHNGFVSSKALTIFGGGGLIWEYTFPPLLADARKAVASGSTVIGIGLGVQGFYTTEKFVFLKQFKALTVRNEESAKSLLDLLEIKAEVTQDLAWIYDPPVVKKDQNALGVIVPDLSTYPQITKALTMLNHFEIRYIPFAEPTIPQYELAQKTTGGRVLGHLSRAKTKDVFRELAKCRFILAGHLHALIGAFLTATPCVVLPFRDKVRWMAQKTGYRMLEALTMDEIFIKVKMLERFEAEIKTHMMDTVKREREVAERNIDVIARFL